MNKDEETYVVELEKQLAHAKRDRTAAVDKLYVLGMVAREKLTLEEVAELLCRVARTHGCLLHRYDLREGAVRIVDGDHTDG